MVNGCTPDLRDHHMSIRSGCRAHAVDLGSPHRGLCVRRDDTGMYMKAQLASLIQQKNLSAPTKGGKKSKLNNATGQVLHHAAKAVDIPNHREQEWEGASHS